MHKKCNKCDTIKPLSSFRQCRLYRGMEQGEYTRSCEKRLAKQLAQAKIDAPPKTKKCCCCFSESDHLVLDHDHETGKFRGWLCRNCNQGIGKLGDNLQGVTKAVKYLICRG